MKTGKRIKRILASAAALSMAALLSACGRDADASSAHSYTYTTLAGNEYSGTYTGGWEGGQPNGEGSFSGKGEKGEIPLVGTWADGKPNGQCRQITKSDTYIKTYSGDFFYGELKGNGDFKTEDLNGNLVFTYSGEFRDSNYNGTGEWTKYYTAEEAAEQGYDRRVYTGQFADGTWNGEGKLTIYYTAEATARHGCGHQTLEAVYSDGKAGGDARVTYYYTKEYAEANGFNCEILTGQYGDNGLVEPYRYTLYNGNKVLEEGRVTGGKYVSDAEKALNDTIYDGLRAIAGDGILGDLYDIFAPEIYDRNAE